MSTSSIERGVLGRKITTGRWLAGVEEEEVEEEEEEEEEE